MESDAFFLGFWHERHGDNMVNRRRVLLIAACLIVTAVAIVLLVTIFAGGKADDYDGTLVRSVMPVLLI